MTARYRIIECEQGSPEWFEARRGIPTASRYGDVLAQGQGKTREKYLNQLAFEDLTGKLMKGYTNENMERGKAVEADLRAKYAYDIDDNVETISFLRSTLLKTGCSPDGLIGAHGVVEIKSTEDHLQVGILKTGIIPSEHIPQIQGILWLTGRKWCDLVYGHPDLPLYIRRIERDEGYMANLRNELTRFIQDLDMTVEKLRNQ
jgi:hypothetical protein